MNFRLTFNVSIKICPKVSMIQSTNFDGGLELKNAKGRDRHRADNFAARVFLSEPGRGKARFVRPSWPPLIGQCTAGLKCKQTRAR